MRKILSGAAIAAGVGLVIGFMALMPVQAGHDDDRDRDRKPEPTAVGAWFGIARPCNGVDAINDSPLHADFCHDVCGACPFIPGTLPPEVPMMPTLLADGTVLADDAGEISVNHTTAHGKWAVSEHDGLPNRRGTQRLKATFFWLGGNPPAPGTLEIFSNSVRPRFVTYFDPRDPDRMIGFIQPYFFPFVDPHTGLVVVRPRNPLDDLAGNHIPALDPLRRLPDGCQTSLGCLGTFHFVIRRINAQ